MSERMERRVVATEVVRGDEVLMNLAEPDVEPDRQWCEVLWQGTPAMWPESFAIVSRKPDGSEQVHYVTPGCPMTVRGGSK